MIEKKRGRIITGWRQVIAPKVRAGKPRPIPPPRGKAAPALPLVPGRSPGEDEGEKGAQSREPAPA